MTAERFDEILGQFSDVTVAVVGDYFLDEYLIIAPELAEASVETGLDAHQIVARRISPGAAGNVVSNLHALGVGEIIAAGLIGDDGHGFEMRRVFADWNVDMEELGNAAGRLTPTYTKPMLREAAGERELNRMDIRWREPLPAAEQGLMIARLRRCTERADGIIIVDQVAEGELGCITGKVRAEVGHIGAAMPDMPIFIDSRGNIEKYENAIIKPNAFEGAAAVSIEMTDSQGPDEAEEVTGALAAKTGRPVFMTLGEHGIGVRDGEKFSHVPGYRIEGPVDICGAGDSTTASIVPALCAGASPVEAAVFGIVTSSITIEQLGVTGVANSEQLRRRFAEYCAQQA